MSKTTKIVLGALGALLLLCACVAVAGGYLFTRAARNMIQSDPAAARATADAIADFALPAGYGRDAIAFNLMGVKMAVFTGQSGQAIMFLSVPTGGSAAQNDMVTRQMQDQINARMAGQMSLAVVAHQAAVVRGQQVEMTISEGGNANGIRYREGTLAFTGKNGPALLMILQPIEQWDQREVDRFLASIR